jgi:hypothetical protein
LLDSALDIYFQNVIHDPVNQPTKLFLAIISLICIFSAKISKTHYISAKPIIYKKKYVKLFIKIELLLRYQLILFKLGWDSICVVSFQKYIEQHWPPSKICIIENLFSPVTRNLIESKLYMNNYNFLLLIIVDFSDLKERHFLD